MRTAHIEVIGKRLQHTVAAAGTVRTRNIVMGKDQTQVGAARFTHLGTVGMNDHTVCHDIIAGRNKPLHTVHLYHTKTAGTDLVDIL